MSFSKFLISIVVSVQLIFGSISTLAAESKLTAAQKKAGGPAIIRAILDNVAYQSSLVNTHEDFEKFNLRGLKASDRKAIMNALADQKEFPTFQRIGDALVVGRDHQRVELRLLQIGKFDFLVNGVSWSYNPFQPFMPQFQELQTILKPKKNAAWFQLLPEAEALAWLAPLAPFALMAAGAIIATLTSDLTKEFLCAWDPMGSASCAELRKQLDEAVFKDAPSLDAVSNQLGAENRLILANYQAEDWICPSTKEGKTLEYRGRLRKVETKDGVITPISSWFNVVAKFNTTDGLPTDVIISTGDADPAMIDISPKKTAGSLVIHVAFDAVRKKPISYRLPNPNYNADRDLLGSPVVTLKPSLKLTPDQKSQIDNAKILITKVNTQIYTCVGKKVEGEQLAGISTEKIKVTPASNTEILQ